MLTARSASRVTCLLAIIVSLVATAYGAPSISYAAGSGRHAEGLNVTYTMGDPLPGLVAASVTSNLGSVPFTYAASAAWIQVTPSGSVTPATLQIQINPSGLAVGNYTGTLTVATTISQGGKIIDWTDTSTITLKVNAAPASTPNVSPGSLTFDGGVGQPIAPKGLNLSSAPTSLPYSITTSQGWIGVSPSSGVTGSSGAALTVTINPSGLAAGTHTGQIAISLPGGTPNTINVPVTLNLVSAATDIVPPSITLTGTGQQGAAAVLLGSFSPVGNSAASLGYTITIPGSAPWLSATPLSGTTPANVQVYANPKDLTPATYNANLQVNLVNGNPASYTIPVSFTVTAPPPVNFGVSLAQFALNITTANPISSPPVPVTVSATQGAQAASEAFTVATDKPWLKAVPTAGTTPATIAISADASASPLAAGTYNGTVNISSGGAVQATVQVTLNVASSALAQFSSKQVSLAAQAGEQTSTSGSVALNVTTQSADPLNYRVTSNRPWLTLIGSTLDTVSSASPKTLAVDVDARTLNAGTSVATLMLETLDMLGNTIGTDTAAVTAIISAPPAEIALDRNLLNLNAVSGAAPSTLGSLAVTTGAGGTAFTVTKTAAWLTVTPTSGHGSQMLAVKVDPSQLGPGDYSDTITVSGPTSQATANVQLTVVAPGALPFTLSPATVALTTFSNVPQPPSQIVTLTGVDSAALGNNIYKWSTTVSTVNGGGWLAASLDTSSFPFTVTVFASPSSLNAGTYNGTVTVIENAGSIIQHDIPVTFTIQNPVANSYALSLQTVSKKLLTGSTVPYQQNVALVPKLSGLTFTSQLTMDNGAGWLSLANSTGNTMPATMDIVLTPTSLPAGIYTGKVTYTAVGGTGVVVQDPMQSVSVRMVIKDPPPPEIVVRSSSQVSFQFTAGSSVVSPDNSPLVTLGYTSIGFATATVTSSANWLRFTAPSYEVTSDGVTVFASVDPGSAPSVPGTYSATYLVNGPNGKVTEGSVTLLVLGGAPTVALTPQASSIVVTAGSFNTAGSPVTLQNTGTSSVSFGVSTSSSGWLGIANGMTGGTLAPNQSVQIVPSAVGNLAAGNRFGSLTVIATNGTANVMATHQVVLQVQSPDLSGISVEQPGSQSGPADGSPLTYTIRITNPTAQSLPFVITSTVLTSAGGSLTDLSISPDLGSIGPNANQEITIQAKAPVSGGLFGNAIMLFINGIGFQRNITYSSLAAAGSGCVVDHLIPVIQQPSDRANLAGSLPVVITAIVSDNCGTPLTNGTVTASFSNGDDVVALRSPAGDGIWQGTWVPTSTTDPEVAISVSALDGAGTMEGAAEQTVFVTATAGVPTINSGGIVNAADFSSPNIAQTGSYISISGQNLASGEFSSDSDVNLPTLLGDTQVLLAGTPMGLKAVSPTAITAFVPNGLPVDFSLPLQVVRGDLESVPQNLYITDKNPALFLASNDETRPGLFVVTRGGTSFQVDVDHPALAGDVLTVTATGLGWTDGDGKVTGAVVLKIGGVSIIPSSSTLASGVIGVYEVTVTVPAGITPGNEVPVTISVDGQASKAVTIAIQ